MTKWYIQNCFMSFIISKMEIKTTMTYNITPQRLVQITKNKKNYCWHRYVRKELSFAIGQNTLLSSLSGKQYGYYFKNQILIFHMIQPYHSQDHRNNMIVPSTLQCSQHCFLQQQQYRKTQVPNNRCVATEAMVYLHNGIELSCQNK